MTDPLMQAVVDAVPDPMLRIGRAGEIATANPAARALLGNWIAGRPVATVLRQPGLLTRIEAALAGQGAQEARFERADQTGETLYAVRITPLGATELRRSAQGSGQGLELLLHFADVTHLREAAEMRRDFVANVSHELRTPLTALLGFIETLRGPARNDDSARMRFLGIMEEEARRMNRLVSDLLSLSRVESEERMRPNTPVDLSSVLASVLAALRPAAEETGNSIDLLDSTGGDSTLQGDRDQLTQVFMNLVENALKYGGPGKPVLLRMGRETGTGLLKGPVLRVDVVDQGDGIDATHLPRLTERFYRVDNHRSRAMGGTGLGLAIVKHIVNRHRGRLRITSDKGQGSCFSVFLPATTPILNPGPGALS